MGRRRSLFKAPPTFHRSDELAAVMSALSLHVGQARAFEVAQSIIASAQQTFAVTTLPRGRRASRRSLREQLEAHVLDRLREAVDAAKKARGS